MQKQYIAVVECYKPEGWSVREIAGDHQQKEIVHTNFISLGCQFSHCNHALLLTLLDTAFPLSRQKRTRAVWVVRNEDL